MEELSPHEVLAQYWGYNRFRPLQEEIIHSILQGNDTLALLPTGGGKSICFQVPALCQTGVCIVVSPLIALMKDQVQNLVKRGVPAIAIYSGMHYTEIDRLLDNCVYGNVKFLYVSPERLQTPIFLARVQKMSVCMLAIDEAHCISQWGYDFRPPYLQISELRKLLPTVPIIALTATATPEVVEDIQRRLNFREGNVFQQSFKRDNLVYVVLEEEKKEYKTLDILRKVAGTSVVYVRNRGKTLQVADYLRLNGISAAAYHAGLSAEQRSQAQEDWIQGRIRVMVATNAFGMGIDKPNVRSVVHIDVPDNLEAYFQEAGRAGRDGEKAYSVLLYNKNDESMLRYQWEMAYPEITVIKQVYHSLCNYFQLAVGSGENESFDFEIDEFAKRYNYPILSVHYALKLLEEAGWIHLSEAVFTPSALCIRVGKEQLYDFMLKNPQSERFLKAVLRLYDGVQQNFVPLKEKEAANGLKITPLALRSLLQLLHKQQIIDYLPMKDKPQLTFLKERAAPENVRIEEGIYKFRKKRQAEKITAVVAYCETNVCRSQQLTRYFGEENAAVCGVCDVCLAEKKALKAAAVREKMVERIKETLRAAPQNSQQLVDIFNSLEQAEALNIINALVLERVLVADANGSLRLAE